MSVPWRTWTNRLEISYVHPPRSTVISIFPYFLHLFFPHLHPPPPPMKWFTINPRQYAISLLEHLLLILHEFWICKFTYSQILFVRPKSILLRFHGHSWTCTRVVKNLSCQSSSAEVKQANVLPFFFSVFFPSSLRYNWHITLCKFKVYKVLIWYTYILQNDYSLSIS